MVKPEDRIKFISGLAIAGIVVSLALNWLFDEPSDLVNLTINNIPNRTRLIMVVSQDERGVEFLSWYINKLFWSPMSPKDSTLSSFDPSKDGLRFYAETQWRHADKYGVLCQDVDGGWLIWWCGSDDVRTDENDGPRSIRNPKRAQMTIHLNEKRGPEVPTRSFLSDLGLKD